jgi:hypothetical protein
MSSIYVICPYHPQRDEDFENRVTIVESHLVTDCAHRPTVSDRPVYRRFEATASGLDPEGEVDSIIMIKTV